MNGHDPPNLATASATRSPVVRSSIIARTAGCVWSCRPDQGMPHLRRVWFVDALTIPPPPGVSAERYAAGRATARVGGSERGRVLREGVSAGAGALRGGVVDREPRLLEAV